MAAIHHENIPELTSLRFLKLNLECQNIKMGRTSYGHLVFFFFFFFFHETALINITQLDTTVVSTVAVFFLKSSYHDGYKWSKNISLTVK